MKLFHGISLEKTGVSFCFFFSDEKLSNFTRSKTLPFPEGYYTQNRNPILEVLADQLKYDSEWSMKAYVSSALLNDILKALDENQLAWPNNFSLLSSNEWVKRMRIDPIFYKHHATDDTEMKMYEDLLLKLVANFLEKQIKLIPILDEDPELTIEPSTSTINSTSQLHIAYCNRCKQDNFFVSVIPKPS